MSNIKRVVTLLPEQRESLIKITSSGEHPSRKIRRAQIVLALDTSKGRVPEKEELIAKRYGVTKQTVHNVKWDFFDLGIDNFLQRRTRETPPVPAKVDGEFEAHLIALCCTEPPEGYAKWSVRLLADRVVELGYIDSISHMTVSRTLKKMNLSLT